MVNYSTKALKSPDLTLRGTNAALVEVLMTGKLRDASGSGPVKAEGRIGALEELLGLVSAPEFWFQIVTRPAWVASSAKK